MNKLQRSYRVDDGDFAHAGEASRLIKQMLKDLGFPADMVKRASISTYEAEINMVIHAHGGRIYTTVTPEQITIVCADTGPGIPDVELAMQEGWSTAPQDVRVLGFGAGMGLPNIKKYADELQVETRVGAGTTLTLTIRARKDGAP